MAWRAVVLKRIMAVLAALNGLWYSSEEAGWLRYRLGRMTLKPHGIEDTLSLVADRMPWIDVDMIRRRRELPASLPCWEPPAGLPPEG